MNRLIAINVTQRDIMRKVDYEYKTVSFFLFYFGKSLDYNFESRIKAYSSSVINSR